MTAPTTIAERAVVRGEFAKIADFLVEVAKQGEQDAQARDIYHWALDLDRRNVGALNGLGRCCMKAKDWFRAGVYAGQVCDVKQTAASRVMISVCEEKLGRYQDAIRSAILALDIDPSFVPAYQHLWGLYRIIGDNESARRMMERGMEIDPTNDPLQFVRGGMAFEAGEYESAWRDCEHRETKVQLNRAMDEFEEWDGSPLNGRTLLIAREQGLGDAIMFSRYLPKLADETVVLYTYPELARLFAANFPDIQIVTCDLDVPEFDVWCGIGSLPLKLKFARPEPLPFNLRPPSTNPQVTNIPTTGRLRVGLCWKGNPKHLMDAYRSIPFSAMKPILDVPGCDFYSLQSGDKESSLDKSAFRSHDLADTAGIIEQLDLVISCDTAIAHLAGAMSKPVWMLSGMPGDWRWAAPWYPSMEIIGATEPKAWTEPAAAAASALERFQRSGAAVAREAHNLQAVGSNPTSATNITTRACKYGEMAFYTNDHYIGRSLDLYGEYSEAEVELFRRVLKPGDVIVEAGANIGAHTLPLAQIVGTKGEVIAFEPQPEYVSLLEKNAAHVATIYSTGLGNPPLAGGGKTEVIELPLIPSDRIHAPGWTPSLKERAHFVTVETLDAYDLSRLDFFKIDVDGAEHDILKGAEQTIARCRPIIYVEYDKPDKYPDMLPWLMARNYRVYQHNSRLYNPNNSADNPVNVFGNIVSLMLLCIPIERKDLRGDNIGLPLSRVRMEKR